MGEANELIELNEKIGECAIECEYVIVGGRSRGRRGTSPQTEHVLHVEQADCFIRQKTCRAQAAMRIRDAA